MDLLKAKIYLDKVNREFGRMSKDPENIARIDIDIMLSYLRDLYDAFLTVPPAAPPSTLPKTDSRRNTRQDTPGDQPAPTYSAPPSPPSPPSPPVSSPPPPEEKPAPAPPAPVAPVAPVVPVTPEPPAPVVPPPAQPESRQDLDSPLSQEFETLFEFKEAKELSEKLSEAPITDLRRAISLNDRLLLARELFGDDKQLFETAILTLNNFADFSQARDYITQNFVSTFDWTSTARIEAAKKFIKLVRRRYK